MKKEKQNKRDGSEIASDILSGAVTALSYTDEEILATLPPEEAKEFIELRNKVLAEIDDNSDYSHDSNDNSTLLAAEEETPYE